jgi:diguanylate cyclase (GGDEF)-like protein
MQRTRATGVRGVARIAELLHSPRTSVGQLALGRALLLTFGLLVDSTIWSLDPKGSTVPLVGSVSIVLLAVGVLSSRLPWTDDPSRLPLLFPLCVLAGLTTIGLADHNGGTSAYAGLIVLCFVYLGLTQPPGTSLRLMPAAAGTWLAAQDEWSAAIAIRLVIAVIVWLVVGELLGYRSQRAARDRITLSGHANTDALTGLINRRGLDTRLSRATNGDTVVMCDLDHFKVLNDRDGHAAGDQALADFGALLRGALRGEDAAGRYGGEEFVLLLADTSPEAALDVLHRMRARWSTTQPGVTFSSGIAAISDAIPIGAAMAAADEALYASKSAGRNCDHISYQQIVRAN